jgi:predicted acyl esterase
VLDADEGEPGARDYLVLGAGTGRVKASEIDPPATLTWTTAPLDGDLDVVGEFELALVASATAADTAWLATLQDVAPDGETTDVTAGWLRAGLREVDEAASTPGAPVLPCRTPVAVPIGEDVEYRIPLVPNARRFAKGHRLQLVIASDDQDPKTPAIMNFRHAGVGTSSRNTISSTSRLLLSVLSP